MNSTSFVFALSMAALVAGTAWLIDWGANRNNHWNTRKRKIVMSLMLLLSVVTGVFVYKTDSAMRGATLFEVADIWEKTGDRTHIVEVEHPGIEHTLTVRPYITGLESAARPVILRCQFGVEGEPPLVVDESAYEVVRKSGKNSSGMTWEAKTFPFIPTRSGTHLLTCQAVDGYPPKLHLRIADPEKRDGRRAPGY